MDFFYKTRLLGLGNIGLNIKFGRLSFKIKKVVTLVNFVKASNLKFQKTAQMEIFIKQDL